VRRALWRRSGARGRARCAGGVSPRFSPLAKPAWQHPWQHPYRPIRPYRPRRRTIWTLLHDLDVYDTRVTRLRAWSRLTGWRFESSSAHVGNPAIAGFPAFRCGCRCGSDGPVSRSQRCSHAARRDAALPATCRDRDTDPGRRAWCIEGGPKGVTERRAAPQTRIAHHVAGTPPGRLRAVGKRARGCPHDRLRRSPPAHHGRRPRTSE